MSVLPSELLANILTGFNGGPSLAAPPLKESWPAFTSLKSSAGCCCGAPGPLALGSVGACGSGAQPQTQPTPVESTPGSTHACGINPRLRPHLCNNPQAPPTPSLLLSTADGFTGRCLASKAPAAGRWAAVGDPSPRNTWMQLSIKQAADEPSKRLARSRCTRNDARCVCVCERGKEGGAPSLLRRICLWFYVTAEWIRSPGLRLCSSASICSWWRWVGDRRGEMTCADVVSWSR